eukprot:gnl/MRDRNA2_/MRDRNA2_104233_c0_seq1.p1 gnl/MRDRNA2_/MRDRNA2_104233_c0~~gnl/MRDRNA2_/MRDRNA2_104233_c0_seq1.p1  ORF type:complete len:900 (-),score=216.65 gnl/MRDRNA2_/MRDRNA2_104233_c0_seq1:174-2873(-)
MPPPSPKKNVATTSRRKSIESARCKPATGKRLEEENVVEQMKKDPNRKSISGLAVPKLKRVKLQPPAVEQREFGCSKCRWSSNGCSVCNPAKKARMQLNKLLPSQKPKSEMQQSKTKCMTKSGVSKPAQALSDCPTSADKGSDSDSSSQSSSSSEDTDVEGEGNEDENDSSKMHTDIQNVIAQESTKKENAEDQLDDAEDQQEDVSKLSVPGSPHMDKQKEDGDEHINRELSINEHVEVEKEDGSKYMEPPVLQVGEEVKACFPGNNQWLPATISELIEKQRVVKVKVSWSFSWHSQSLEAILPVHDVTPEVCCVPQVEAKENIENGVDACMHQAENAPKVSAEACSEKGDVAVEASGAESHEGSLQVGHKVQACPPGCDNACVGTIVELIEEPYITDVQLMWSFSWSEQTLQAVVPIKSLRNKDYEHQEDPSEPEEDNNQQEPVEELSNQEATGHAENVQQAAESAPNDVPDHMEDESGNGRLQKEAEDMEVQAVKLPDHVQAPKQKTQKTAMPNKKGAGKKKQNSNVDPEPMEDSSNESSTSSSSSSCSDSSDEEEDDGASGSAGVPSPAPKSGDSHDPPLPLKRLGKKSPVKSTSSLSVGAGSPQGPEGKKLLRLTRKSSTNLGEKSFQQSFAKLAKRKRAPKVPAQDNGASKVATDGTATPLGRKLIRNFSSPGASRKLLKTFSSPAIPRTPARTPGTPSIAPGTPRTPSANLAVPSAKRQNVFSLKNDQTNPQSRGAYRSTKERLAADLACRWWYVLPDWPVHDEARYREELAKRKLRKIDIQDWEFEPDFDKDGLKKVFELGQFKGCFRDSAGKLYDLRNKEGCPSYNNFMKKSQSELCSLLVKAYENQATALSSSRWADESLEAELRSRQAVVQAFSREASQSEKKRRRIHQ